MTDSATAWPIIERLAAQRFRVTCPTCTIEELFDNIIDARVLRDTHVSRHRRGEGPSAGSKSHLTLVEATPFYERVFLQDWKHLVSALAGYRARRGYTQLEVAELMNVGSSTISKLERLKVEPKFSVLCAYARVLGVDLELLASRE